MVTQQTLAAVADADLVADEDGLADGDALADARATADVDPVPDARAGADLGACVDDGCFVCLVAHKFSRKDAKAQRGQGDC